MRSPSWSRATISRAVIDGNSPALLMARPARLSLPSSSSVLRRRFNAILSLPLILKARAISRLPTFPGLFLMKSRSWSAVGRSGWNDLAFRATISGAHFVWRRRLLAAFGRLGRRLRRICRPPCCLRGLGRLHRLGGLDGFDSARALSLPLAGAGIDEGNRFLERRLFRGLAGRQRRIHLAPFDI